MKKKKNKGKPLNSLEREFVSAKIRRLKKEGRPQKEAVAIALSMAREGRFKK